VAEESATAVAAVVDSMTTPQMVTDPLQVVLLVLEGHLVVAYRAVAAIVGTSREKAPVGSTTGNLNGQDISLVG
jgi:alkylated DNA nucleotide flippase Atl1